MLKKTSAKIIIFLLLLASLFAAGCSTENQSEDKSGYDKPKFLTIGTAASGGAYYPIGISMADIITNELDIQTTAQVTGGAVENNKLIENKEIDIAITQSSMAYAAYHGMEPYKQNSESVNILFNGLSKGIFHVVVMNNSGINAMSDLKGKKVVMGPAGGGAINTAKDVWGEYGFGIDDIKATYISYSDGISSLKDGNVDAVVVQSAAPAAAIKELAATTNDFKILSIEEDKKKNILEKYPYYAEIKLDKELYDTSEEAATIYVTNMAVVNKDLPDELVYEITKVLFKNIEKIRESHPAAKGIALENAAKNLPIPMHPGAEKYFKEKEGPSK